MPFYNRDAGKVNKITADDRLLDMIVLPKQSVKRLSKTNKSSKAIEVGKSTTFPLGVYSNGVASSDLGLTKWGAAMAFNLVSEVYSAVRLIYEDIAALDWNIVIADSDGNDKIVASKSERDTTNPAASALNNFQISPGIKSNMFMYMTMDYLLYGQTVTELVGSDFDQSIRLDFEGTGKKLLRLNPLGVSIDDSFGAINHIQYGWNNHFVQIPLANVAYDIWPNPLSDIEGYSPILAALQKINIVRDFVKFLRAFFGSNGRPGMVITPNPDAQGKV